MNFKISKKILASGVAFVLFIVIVPSISNADLILQNTTNPAQNSPATNIDVNQTPDYLTHTNLSLNPNAPSGSTAAPTGLVPCDGSSLYPCDFKAFVGMINGFIQWIIGISATIATITFAVAGIRILLHPDNPGERGAAIDMFKKSVIGLVVLLCAWVIVHFIIVELTQNSSTYLKFLQ
jgi:hypothetical protein